MFYQFLIIGSLNILFHHIFKRYKLEKQLYEKYSVNMTRSLMCASIAYDAYSKFNYLWIDKCLDNIVIENTFKEFHSMFYSYFIFDTIILWYQVYIKIEKSIRVDLLLHHILAITALIMIEEYQMYGLTLIIGLSEGMSIVSGPKLLSVYYGNKYLTNIYITYRLLYLFFVRILFIWPFLIYYYHKITTECDRYKDNKNILLVYGMIFLIFHADVNWINNGRKELARI